MIGELSDDARTVECSDDVLAAVKASNGRAWIVDSTGDYTSAELRDGSLRCEARIKASARRRVEVRLRGAQQ